MSLTVSCLRTRYVCAHAHLPSWKAAPRRRGPQLLRALAKSSRLWGTVHSYSQVESGRCMLNCLRNLDLLDLARLYRADAAGGSASCRGAGAHVPAASLHYIEFAALTECACQEAKALTRPRKSSCFCPRSLSAESRHHCVLSVARLATAWPSHRRCGVDRHWPAISGPEAASRPKSLEWPYGSGYARKALRTSLARSSQ